MESVLNKETEIDPMPTNTAEDLLLRLAESKYFSKIHFSKGYWQILVADKEIQRIAFVTPDRQYEFLWMLFGMVKAGATLVPAIKILLKGMSGVESYTDIFVHSAT